MDHSTLSFDGISQGSNLHANGDEQSGPLYSLHSSMTGLERSVSHRSALLRRKNSLSSSGAASLREVKDFRHRDNLLPEPKRLEDASVNATALVERRERLNQRAKRLPNLQRYSGPELVGHQAAVLRPQGLNETKSEKGLQQGLVLRDVSTLSQSRGTDETIGTFFALQTSTSNTGHSTQQRGVQVILDANELNMTNFQPTRKLEQSVLLRPDSLESRDGLANDVIPIRGPMDTDKRDVVDRSSAPHTDALQIDCSANHTFLGYQIPGNTMRDAMLASRSTAAAYWQYSLYQGPGGKGDRVKVHYCRSLATTERIAQLFLNQAVVGFDIEWKPQAAASDGTKKNVSLIQFATEERIALFHIARYAGDDSINVLVAPTLKRIMENPSISKVGVAVKADCTRLRKFMGIKAQGLFELSHLYNLVKFSGGNVKKINKRLVALAQQVEEHLQLPMYKGDVRSSDWSEELNYQQIQYAASDSYAGLRLYDVMEGKRKALDPMPPRPAHAELNLPIQLVNGQTVATYDDSEEAPKETEVVDEQPVDMEEMARDFFNIAIEDYQKDEDSATRKQSTSTLGKSPEIVAAEEWIRDRQSQLPPAHKARASPALLRAYALWHHQERTVLEAAALLRDPPLQSATVSNYILGAIKMERLPFDAGRLHDVLECVPESVVKARYQALSKSTNQEESRRTHG